jgi:hypothetical protein
MKPLQTFGYTLLGLAFLAIICGSFYYLLDWVKEYYHCKDYGDAFYYVMNGILALVGGIAVLFLCFKIGQWIISLFGNGSKRVD